jgi:hypothetical protein
MADLAIITPTRGRPRQFAEMVRAVHATAAGSVEIYAAIDDDDPADYFAECKEPPGDDLIRAYRGVRRSLSGWTNHLAQQALDSRDPPRYLASLGDDHRPRTPRWDLELIGAIETLGGAPGFAYGNDLYQGVNLCTAWVVSAEIVRALGWMMLPVCEHLYVDNATLALGRASGRILYRPGVVIEHLHPVAGKAEWDDTYRSTNNDARYAADSAAFAEWQRGGGLAGDVATLRRIPAGAVASRA